MILVQENIKIEQAGIELLSAWQPNTSWELLEARAHLLNTVRNFFLDRSVLEVETPLLASSSITDPNIEIFATGAEQKKYLQTSPEYAMKRLLCAGSGPIFQIAKAFRAQEVGRYHNPEFSILEWYRPGYDYHKLMLEVFELIQICLARSKYKKIAYRDIFYKFLSIDPFTANKEEILLVARSYIDQIGLDFTRAEILDLLMGSVLQPKLRTEGVCFIFDYPKEQAALAKLRIDNGVAIAERFELFVDGVELANGYTELEDESEQRRRFNSENNLRIETGKEPRPIDERLLAALGSGLPFCSGVAVGLDRLLMLQMDCSSILETLTFSWDNS